MDDPHLFRPSPSEFRCGEAIERGGTVGSVIFFLEYGSACRLTFGCRDRSVGVLGDSEEAVKSEDIPHEADVDPNFSGCNHALTLTHVALGWKSHLLIYFNHDVSSELSMIFVHAVDVMRATIRSTGQKGSSCERGRHPPSPTPKAISPVLRSLTSLS